MWWVLLGRAAGAADATDLPPALGLKAGLEYRGSALTGRLVEGGETVSRRSVTRHDLDVLVEFAPIDGLALTLDLATTPSYRFAYADSRSMVVEPLTGSGSYLTGQPVAETPTVRAGGVDGVWIGVAGAPFAERYDASQRATSRLDLAFRTPSQGRNLWTANADGKRGPSPGGSAMHLGAAFSSQRGVTTPWLRADWLRESAVTVDVVDEAGHTWARGLELRPAGTFVGEAGFEVLAAEDEEAGTRYAADLWLGAGYRTWEDVASGVYLPNVLDGPRRIAVTASDTVLARAGIALDSTVQDLLHLRLGLTVDYAMPYQLEHVYAVTTSPDTIQIGWQLEIHGVGSFESPDRSDQAPRPADPASPSRPADE